MAFCSKNSLLKNKKSIWPLLGVENNLKIGFLKAPKWNQAKTLYGLSSWDNISIKKCCIHLTWFIKTQPWNHIELSLAPANEDYQIAINGVKIESSINSRFQGKILLKKYAPYIQMELCSNTAHNQKIGKFECLSINRCRHGN